MGGAIAVILASEAPPEALVLLAPYLTMGKLTSTFASLWPLWQLATPKLFTDPKRGLHDRVARANALGSWWFTPRLVRELKRIVERAGPALRQVRRPTLVLHTRSDYRIPARSATRAFEQLGAEDKTLQWCEHSGHVLAADAGRDAVIAAVAGWLDVKMPPR
jgi:esterase/lipase